MNISLHNCASKGFFSACLSTNTAQKSLSDTRCMSVRRGGNMPYVAPQFADAPSGQSSTNSDSCEANRTSCDAGRIFCDARRIFCEARRTMSFLGRRRCDAGAKAEPEKREKPLRAYSPYSLFFLLHLPLNDDNSLIMNNKQRNFASTLPPLPPQSKQDEKKEGRAENVEVVEAVWRQCGGKNRHYTLIISHLQKTVEACR